MEEFVEESSRTERFEVRERVFLLRRKTLSYLRKCWFLTQTVANRFEGRITPIQWNALVFLDRYGSLSQRQLATYLHREPATVTRSIDKMETMGLVVREPDESDRRVNVIAMTEKACDLLAEVQPPAERAALTVRGDLSAKEEELLIGLLDRVYESCVSAE